MKIHYIFLPLMLLTISTAAFADSIDDNNICYAQFRTGNNKGAIDYCTRAIESGELEPGDLVPALINRGVAYRAEGRSKDAVTDYTRALMYTPKDAMLYANRANALRDLGEYDQAMDDVNEAIKLDPQRGASFYVRGAVYEAKGESSLARKDYLQALAFDPENAEYKKKLLGMDGAAPEVKP